MNAMEPSQYVKVIDEVEKVFVKVENEDSLHVSDVQIPSDVQEVCVKEENEDSISCSKSQYLCENFNEVYIKVEKEDYAEGNPEADDTLDDNIHQVFVKTEYEESLEEQISLDDDEVYVDEDDPLENSDDVNTLHTEINKQKTSKESKVPSPGGENKDNIYVEDNSSLCNTKESFEHIDGENSEEGDKVQSSASAAELYCTEKEGDFELSGGQTATVKGKVLCSYVCDICKKSCKRKDNLGNHVRIHYEDRPYACRICNKRFKQQHGRHKHEMLHRKQEKIPKGNKLYTCGTCGKQYCSKESLQSHSYVHTKRYCCSVCGKCFTCNTNLQSHIRTHTKEKPFKCHICQKCFTEKVHLKRHVITHSSERPFPCNICGKMFKCKRTRQLHKLNHQKKI